MLIIIIGRLLLSSLILRFPLFGAILAIFLDYYDWDLLIRFDQAALEHYQQWDKILDLAYLSLEAYIAYKWRNIYVRISALLLFVYRLIGVLFFEFTDKGIFLVIFPNVFEYFYLTYLIQLKFLKKDYLRSFKIVIIVIVLLLAPKVFHEYLLHINTTLPWSENKYVKRIIDPDFLDISLKNH